MNKLLLILIIVLPMPSIEDYIGKSIYEFPNWERLQKTDNAGHLYQLYEGFEFLNEQSSNLSIKTKNDETITAISLFFKGKMSRKLFDKMTENYGRPNKMFKMGNIIQVDSAKHSSYESHSIKGVARECSFEEDPLSIIWQKATFELVIHQHPDNNHFSIQFSLCSQ